MDKKMMEIVKILMASAEDARLIRNRMSEKVFDEHGIDTTYAYQSADVLYEELKRIKGMLEDDEEEIDLDSNDCKPLTSGEIKDVILDRLVAYLNSPDPQAS